MLSFREVRQNNLKNFRAAQTKFNFPDCDIISSFREVKFGFQNSFSADESNTNQGVKEYCSFGRITFIRRIGKISFVKVRRGKDDIQLVFKKSDTVDIDLQNCLDLGDWITFSGKIGYTSTGEVSVFVKNYDIRQKCLEQLPEKYNGLSDKTVIYNQRYLDLITNTDSVEIFQARSNIIKQVRRYFDDLLEVETSTLQSQASGATAEPFKSYHHASGKDLHLRISPELNLKKLMVGNIHERGVFEIGRSYRNEGLSARHNPEFTMLEAYIFSVSQTVEDGFKEILEYVINFVRTFLGEEKQIVTWSFRDDWTETCNLMPPGLTTNQNYFDEVIEPYLLDKHKNDILIVSHHRSRESPLAKQLDENHAARVEVYVNGIEIMNAYVEQNDVEAQRAAFEAQGTVDEDYLTALSCGMPQTLGIGIGIDRLVMAVLNLLSIKDVILFPH